MATPIRIRQGLDLKIEGAPRPEIRELSDSGIVTVFPPDYDGMKPRLSVKEGDAVRRGSVLFTNKKNDAMKFVSPAAGTVKAVILGPRRVLERIIIERSRDDAAEPFTRYAPEQIPGLPRSAVLNHLLATGFLSLIRQRPFSRMANPQAKPKSIFVNGMATAPFRPDPNVVVQGSEAAFQAGLDILTRLTDGPVHLCLDARTPSPSPALTGAKNVRVHHFDGPHPSGNTSVHIHYVDPIRPQDTVWAARASDVVLIGKLFLDGEVPGTRVVSLGGPGVREESRCHYRVSAGESTAHLLKDKLAEGEQRIIRGDALSGIQSSKEDGLHVMDEAVFVLPEGRERHYMGWIMPGLNVFSQSPSFLSRWFRRNASWRFDTNTHGSKRAMVLTGLYDRYVPMHMMVDFLVRAALAHDSEEAIKLGILETDPEDFALCSFVCPSKTDVVGIIRQGLEQIEQEGI